MCSVCVFLKITVRLCTRRTGKQVKSVREKELGFVRRLGFVMDRNKRMSPSGKVLNEESKNMMRKAKKNRKKKKCY